MTVVVTVVEPVVEPKAAVAGFEDQAELALVVVVVVVGRASAVQASVVWARPMEAELSLKGTNLSACEPS